MDRRVVVTGGSGFIGSYLVEALRERGYEPTILDIQEPRHTQDVRFVQGSVTDRRLVHRTVEQADAVFHLAGILGTHETIDKAYETADVNILGTLNVLDAARTAGAAVLYASKPNQWRNPYTLTKIAAEEFCFMYRDVFGMNVRAARCYNVYGPRQRTHEEGYRKALPTFIVNALRGEALMVYGDGTQSADYIYVKDAVAAMIAVLETDFPLSHAVEVGSGAAVSVNSLAREVIRLTGSTSTVQHVPMRQGESANTRIFADTTVLCRDVRFTPEIDLEEGLRRTLAYYRDREASRRMEKASRLPVGG